MDGQINLPGEEGFLDFLYEESLAANFSQRNVEDLVARSLNPAQGDCHMRRQLFQPRLHPFALMKSQLAAARTNNESCPSLTQRRHNAAQRPASRLSRPSTGGCPAPG